MKLTPKEKAEELVNKYIPHIAGADRYNSTLGIYDNHISKQCALIAVDEILNEYPSQCPKDSYEMERHIFWQEVKEELLKIK